jgi:raffinose/stachyose/melibiose transport system substrate-binding protein
LQRFSGIFVTETLFFHFLRKYGPHHRPRALTGEARTLAQEIVVKNRWTNRYACDCIAWRVVFFGGTRVPTDDTKGGIKMFKLPERERKLSQTFGTTMVVLVVLLGGVTANSANAALPTGPVTLTVQYETSPSNTKEWEAVADAFTKKNPNVTIKWQIITNEAKGGPNLQVLSTSNPPDIGLVPLNSNVYTQLLKGKVLAPLNDIFAADNTVKRIGPPAAALKQPDGNYYAVPNTVAYYNVLWTNPLALAKAKVTLPKNGFFTSVDQLLTATRACVKAGYAGIAIGGKTNFQASWMFDSMLPSAIPNEDLVNFISSHDPSVSVKAKWTDKGVVNTLAALGAIAKGGAYQKGYLGMDLDQATAIFTAGKSCMLLGGSWMPGGAFANETQKGTMKFVPGLATLPGVNPGSKSAYNVYYGNAYAVPAQSNNKAWALELLRYFVSDEGQTIGAVKAAGVVPATNTIPKAELAALPAGVKLVLDHVAKFGAQSGWTSEVPGAYGQQFLNPLIQKLQENKTTAAEISKKLQAELERVRRVGL